MSSNKMATKSDLQEMYSRILPYLGGSADAGFTPVGTVISVMSNHAPANYLICDGTVYNIADYPELANHFLNEFGSKNFFGGNGTTTFAVPDLRGEFLRGTGTNSHATGDNGASVGSHQPPTEVPASIWLDTGNAGYPKVDTNSSADIPLNGVNVTTRTNAVSMKVSSAGALTNQTLRYYAVHPTNTSVLYCIATKDIFMNPSLDFSTEERAVGKWIDGSTLFQRSFRIEKTILGSEVNQWVELVDLSSIGINVANPVFFAQHCFSIYNDTETHIPANWIGDNVYQRNTITYKDQNNVNQNANIARNLIFNFQTSTSKVFTMHITDDALNRDCVLVFTLQYTKS